MPAPIDLDVFVFRRPCKLWGRQELEYWSQSVAHIFRDKQGIGIRSLALCSHPAIIGSLLESKDHNSYFAAFVLSFLFFPFLNTGFICAFICAISLAVLELTVDQVGLKFT